MVLRKCATSDYIYSTMPQPVELRANGGTLMEADVGIDIQEVYFLIMHFLSVGPCRRTFGHFWNELLEHQLLPRRYHAWYSRNGVPSGDENDNGISFPLSYSNLMERYSHIEKDHLVKLLKQLIMYTASPSPLHGMVVGSTTNPVDVPTILGAGSFSLLESERMRENKKGTQLPGCLRWPYMKAGQVRGLALREIGGGFTKHHRAPSVQAACYAIAKPSTMAQKMQIIKKIRGHRLPVYCATFDRSGRYVITGSDDRLVKIWSMETAFCLSSCRGHEGDITDLAVSSNNTLVASASNDFTIRVWRLPDGYPISVLRGHTAAVTAIVFSPRTVYQLLSSSDDGTCRIWDARHSQQSPRIYIPKPPETLYENTNDPPATAAQRGNQILCCSYNANGTVFVTGSSDTYARVWNATVKFTSENAEQPTHEIDVLSGHEDDVNYVQFSGCAVPSRSSPADIAKEDNVPKFKNFWFPHDNIVTCSRDGSAIIWIPRSRRSHHAKAGRWIRAYHLKVPPPPMPLQPSRGGPRQRNQPTPRGVNMIVWSLDNRFVLAAIMDCRICVWNSVDGSLVHSLTGHSASTYVLDVHPFNPRIAMSAGYDGKTIIWDIWEGIPVRVYEIGCFKLVDGKFSPDGTSVVVSDEVGQLYIVATGQGESQKDAKYDQFFLGDYRPLVQDSLGNVVDQETQLAPHRRNIQDLLCDSSMIPYPEPYQNMYQQRRLGSLGIEWRPAPVAFAVGLGDNSQLQAHLLVPFVDPDRWHEPLPEFIEMDWERENDVQTDDTDSEYNIADECSSEGEAESLSNTYSENAECSGEDSEFGLDRKEGIRRSNRRKHMSEVEFMTSSGRRVKRRNLDERDGTMSALTRNSKSVRRKLGSKGKSSVSKLSRPRRRAAKNALSLFSQMNGTSTDGEKYDSESGSSNSGSSLLGSNIQSNESDRSIQHVKEAPTDECELMAKPSELPELLNGGKRRLILKFPIRASKTLGARWLEQGESSSQAAFGLNGSLDPEEVAHSLGNKECDGSKIVEVRRAENVEDLTNFSVGHHENKMKWGEVKARSSKRMRMTHEDQINNDKHKDNVANGDSTDSLLNCDEHVTPYVDEGIRSPHMNNQMHGHLDSMASINGENKERNAGNEHDFFATKASSLKDSIRCNGNYVESGSIKCKVYDEPLKRVGSCTDNGNALSLTCEEFTPDIQAAEQLPQPPTGRLRLRAKRNMNEPHSPTSSQNYVVVKEGWGQCSDEDNLQHEEAEEDDCTPGPTVDHHGRGKLKTHGDGSFGSLETRRYNAVYKRSKAHKSTVNSEMEENSLAENIANSDVKLEVIENEFPRRSRRMKATIPEAISIQSRLSEDPALAETSKHSENFVLNGRETHLSEEIYLNPRMITRSTRSRRGNLYDKELLSKRTTQATKKQSWLMLMEQEESYVPQLGDEVAYIIQGHKQYMQWSGRRFDQGPWEKFKRNIRAVELCRVLCLEYSSLPGSGESCCKLTLEFTDPVSSVYGETFKMTLPELVDFSDFVVLRSRYDAATMRCWSNRDKCEVWWNTGEGGNWYYGRIVSVKPISSEFPDSPWERYTVRYTNGSETYLHSPWELREPGSMWEYPQIDDNIRGKLLSSLVKLEHTSNHSQDSYGIQRLKQAAQKSDFLNRFPVPLSLDVVKQRLENNYYRSLESVKHDAEVILENGKLYFARNTEVITKLQRLQEWFRRTLSL